jgi:hypothetical protein
VYLQVFAMDIVVVNMVEDAVNVFVVMCVIVVVVAELFVMDVVSVVSYCSG